MSLFQENAELLGRMAADGGDLKPPRLIDFAHVFPNRPSAEAFARAVRRKGFATAVEEVEREMDRWDVVASKVMTPTCEHITDTEEHLGTLARSHDGKTDGWGFLRI